MGKLYEKALLIYSKNAINSLYFGKMVLGWRKFKKRRSKRKLDVKLTGIK